MVLPTYMQFLPSALNHYPKWLPFSIHPQFCISFYSLYGKLGIQETTFDSNNVGSILIMKSCKFSSWFKWLQHSTRATYIRLSRNCSYLTFNISCRPPPSLKIIPINWRPDDRNKWNVIQILRNFLIESYHCYFFLSRYLWYYEGY